MESINLDDYLDDLDNVKNIIERSSPAGGLLLPYLDNDGQFKQLSEAVYRVSKSRNTFIKSLKNYIASDEYMDILTNTLRPKVQELRKHFYVAYQRGDTSLEERVHGFPSFRQNLDFLLDETKETLLKWFDDDFKAGRLLKKADKSLSKKDLCFHVYENWNYCTETDEELIERVFIWEINNIWLWDMGHGLGKGSQTVIKDSRTVIENIINEEGNYSKSIQECAKIFNDLISYYKLEDDGLGLTDEAKAIYRRCVDKAAEFINKRSLNLSMRPFELQMRSYKNIPYHCSTPLEYFPLDDYVERYQQNGYTEYHQRRNDQFSLENLGASCAKIIDNKKQELSEKFYEKNAKDLQLISEIGKITKNKDIGNIDIGNALNTCYQILKGYKYSACVYYAENCSREKFFEGWFALYRPNEHQLYKKYLVRDRHDFISSDLLKPNNHYGEIIDELKNQLADELSSTNDGWHSVGTRFYGIMIGDETKYSIKTGNEMHAQEHLADGLMKKLVAEIMKLSKKSFKKLSLLDDWLNYEFQGYYEEEVTRFEAIKKHIAKLEKQDMFNLIRTAREKLDIFKREEKKLNKSKNIIKKYLEDNTKKFEELIESVEVISDVWQIDESVEKFFEVFPKNLLNFGKDLSFFVGNDLAKLYKIDKVEYEPYSESELQTLENILNKIEPKLRLKDEDIYNQNSKLQTKIMKKNIKLAEKLLSIEEKSFLRTWVLQEGQLIYKGASLIQMQEDFQGWSNIYLNKKNRNILNKTMHHELPNYKEIQRANNNVFNAIEDFYEVDENNEITDASINNIKNVIIDLLALIDLKPDITGFLAESLINETKKARAIEDKNKDKFELIILSILNFISFKISTKCEVYISNCMDAITRAVLFLNGVNPFSLTSNPYDELIEDLNAPIKLFEHFQICETEDLTDSICHIMFIWQIVDSLKDLKEYLKLMKLLDIYDVQEVPMIKLHHGVDSYISNKKMRGISNQELAVLAKKVSKHNVVNLKSLEQLINKYEKITPSSMTKFIRDNKNENTEKMIKELFNKKVKSKNLTKPQRKKLEKELLKHSLLHNINDKGLINRDSAIKWLMGRQGNHKKLKKLSSFHLRNSLGFYEFAKLTDWVGFRADVSDIIDF
jgi:hypothetical protein